MNAGSNRVRSLLCPLVCLLSLCSPPRVSGAEKAWAEVRSPHFRVLSDGSERDIRAVARQFEQIRAAFVAALPRLRVDSPVPLLILAPKDESSLRTLVPEMWRRKGIKPGGFFASGWEKTFAVIRLDLVRQRSDSGKSGADYQVIYHEYTHSLLNANFRWLPLWLNEGLAEFFGNTQFNDAKIFLGAPNVRAQYTHGQRLLPLEKLIAVALDSPEYRDPDQVQRFYSESWGLVHFLLVPPAMEAGKPLREFLTLLEQGVDQKQAFNEAIGDFHEVEARLKQYLDGTNLDSMVFDNPAEIKEGAFAFRPLSPAETNAELGTLQVWLHENAAARQSLEQALKSDSRSALAAESMGFLKFSEAKDPEALTHFERALESDGKLHLAAFYKAMLSSAENPAAVRAALNHVLELNPEFAPAYIQLAAGYIREGNFEAAVGPAVKAEQIWPSRAGYHLLIGNLLHALGREREAAAVARYVAERWQDIDHDEAVELWEKLSLAVREGSSFSKRSLVPGARVIDGKISSASCREKNETMTVVIDGMRLTLRAKDEKIKIGFSDTLWYGADHFNRCNHLEGLRAVIQYMPSSVSAISGELVQLDVYDDFVPSRTATFR